MNILDENIPESQRVLLRSWKVKVHQIGYEIGRKGMADEEIIPFLHKLHFTSFFTRDVGFYKRQYCHSNYCLVVLAVGQYEVASFIRRFLHHPHFNTKQKRMGKVIRLTHSGIQIWKQYLEKEEERKWYF